MSMNDLSVYTFRILGFTPETLPMERLGEYIVDLASLMGSTKCVHFECVAEGSAALRIRVEEGARSLVSPRLRDAARGAGDSDVRKAWVQINAKLAQDKTAADMWFPGGEVISFPGSADISAPVGTVSQPTIVQGRLVRLAGTGDLVKIGLDGDAVPKGASFSISADKAQALAHHFRRFVRLVGVGSWRCDADNRWSLTSLVADHFEDLDPEPLTDVLRRARGLLPSGFGEAAIRDLREIRDQ